MKLHLNKEPKKYRSRSKIKIITGTFGGLILLGTLLLTLPFARAEAGRADLLTALFTATSATCVTGLTVVDTATYWSFWGRLVILVLIQIGGLGVMMLGATLALVFGKRITIGQRMLISTSLNLENISGIVGMVKLILRGTLIIEVCGAVALTLCFLKDFPFLQALERGVFLSISAFCNAGFDNIGLGDPLTSIMSCRSDIPVLLVLAALIILGGIGFYVWRDLLDYFKTKKRLSLHTRLVLYSTGVLLLLGTLVFLLAEWNNTTMEDAGPVTRLVRCFFQSVTVRTAGFDHLGQGALTSSSAAFSDILMLIGGSPGSVAGGIKTTTAVVILLSARSALAGLGRVDVLGRTIPQETVNRAYSLFLLATGAAILGAFVISMADGAEFSAALYESISAIATVGLSKGITPTLGVSSKLFLVFLMFLGRVGIVTVSMSVFMNKTTVDSIKLPEGKVMIG